MKKLAFLAFVSLAVMASGTKPSQAHGWHHWHHWHHHCHCWHHWGWWHHHHHPESVVFNDLGPGYVWWNVPYFYLSPYTVLDHVLVHQSTEIGPTSVWP